MSCEDILNKEVSTKTIIAITNITIDLDKLLENLPITPYKPVEKKRGRKKKSFTEVKPDILPEGSIICIQKGSKSRGTIVKKTKKKLETLTFFLHSATIVISLEENKFINVKVSQNGKFQITGCKYDDHACKTMMYIYRHIKNSELITGEKIVQYNDPNKDSTPSFKILFNTVMQNMDYNIGFNVSREKLNTFINESTDFRSIYEGSISTGVAIKIESQDPFDINFIHLIYEYEANTMTEKILREEVINKEYFKHTYYVEDEKYSSSSDEEEVSRTGSSDDDESLKISLENLQNSTEDFNVKDDDYFSYIQFNNYYKNLDKNLIKEKLYKTLDKSKKNKKGKYHTFLVFASGSIIMSSRGPMMKHIFLHLINLLLKNKSLIEEKVLN